MKPHEMKIDLHREKKTSYDGAYVKQIFAIVRNVFNLSFHMCTAHGGVKSVNLCKSRTQLMNASAK